MKSSTRILFLSLLLTSYQMHSVVMDISPNKNASEQFNNYLSLAQQEKYKFTGILTAIILSFHALHYMQDANNSNSTIEEQYPHAYAWYNTMQEKYPVAHFETKKFLSTDHGFSSSFYNIYFSHPSLQTINDIYAKKLQNIALADSEILLLQQNEFLLLCHAGYIENNCCFYNKVMNTAAFVGTELIQVPLLGFFHNMTPINNFIELKNTITAFNTNYNMYAITDMLVYIGIIMPTINKHYELIQYQFACEHADLDALKAGLQFYQNDKAHENITNIINNELAKRAQSNAI